MTDLGTRLQSALGAGYRVEKELGGGGMSRVFLAEEVDLGRRVVVKLLPPDMAAGVNVDRFRREIQLAAKLQHPHVVPLLSAGASGDLLYYVMPFIEGESLRAKLAREGELPVAEALRILRDVLDALAYAHRHHVVHRDIKPDNVLLSEGHALVTDFGVAKAVAESTGKQTLTSVGVALGTPAYMAPEQATADPHTDHRADIYAVGGLAYEMLCGRPPFLALNAQAMLAAHVTEAPEPVTKHRTAVPDALNQLVLRCLEKKPADRWQRADELLPHVESLLTPSGGMTPAPAAPALALGIPRFTGVAALAVALLGTGAFALLRMRDRDRPVDITRVVVTQQPEVPSADPALTAVAAMTADVINAGLARLDWVQAAQPGEPSAAGTTMLSGQVYPVGDSIQLQLRVTEGRSGNLIRGLPPVRLRRDPGVEELQAAVSPALSLVGYVTHPLLGPLTVPAAGLPRFEAFMEFAAAIGVWLRTDTSAFFETMEHLRTARRLDSSFAQAELWLAVHVVRNYRWPAFARELDWLLPVIERGNVPRSPFEAVLARHAALGARGSLIAQLETLRQLAAMAPRSVFAASLPDQLLDLNRPREALSALDQLFRARADGSHAWDEKDYWGFRADILHFLGEYHPELTAARRARKAEPADIQQVRRELRALVALGKFAEVERRLDEVEDAGGTNPFDFAGDVYLQLGQEMVAHGDTAAGRRVIRRAVGWFDRRTAVEWRSPHLRFRAALTYLFIGEAQRALPVVEELHRETPEDPRYLGTIGRVHATTGRSAEAERVLQQLEAMPALLLAGAPTYERASINAILGRKPEAVSLLQESLRQGQGWGIRARLHWFTDWLPYHDYPPFRRLITGQG